HCGARFAARAPSSNVGCDMLKRSAPAPRSQQEPGMSLNSQASLSNGVSSEIELGQIPLIDVSDYLAGKPGALETAAAQLRFATENLGFYYLVGHGVPQRMIDLIFSETVRFHAQPLEKKMAIKLNRSNNGYMPLKGHAQRHSTLNKDPKPNENESF